MDQVWQEDTKGWTSYRGWCLDEPESSMHIRKFGALYRLAEVHPVHGNEPRLMSQDVWQASSVDECMDMAALAWAHHERERALADLPLMRVKRPTHINGVELTASRVEGYIKVEARMAGKCVGHTDCCINRWQDSWVLGEPTVSGGSYIDEKFRGIGLATLMYDLCQELSRLPRVPHGHNGVIGFLSEDAHRFWNKRANLVRVPGFSDPDARHRHVWLSKLQTLIGLERGNNNSPSYLSLLAMLTGHRVQCTRPRYGRLPRAAWLVCDPDGDRVLTLAGPQSRQEVLAGVLERQNRMSGQADTVLDVIDLDVEDYVREDFDQKVCEDDPSDSKGPIDSLRARMEVARTIAGCHWPDIDITSGLARFETLVAAIQASPGSAQDSSPPDACLTPC